MVKSRVPRQAFGTSFINQCFDMVNAAAVAAEMWPPFRASMTALLSSTFRAYIADAGASRIWR
jgi:hypothetical protein